MHDLEVKLAILNCAIDDLMWCNRRGMSLYLCMRIEYGTVAATQVLRHGIDRIVTIDLVDGLEEFVINRDGTTPHWWNYHPKDFYSERLALITDYRNHIQEKYCASKLIHTGSDT